jgi:hypothetical protein
MSDLTPEQDSLVSAIIAKFDERDSQREEAQTESSGSQWSAIKKLVAIKDIVLFVGLLGSLLYGAFVVLGELNAKPSNADMTKAIEVRVKPIEDIATKNADSIEQIESDMTKVKTKVDRIDQVQEVVLEQNSYQSKVLEHVANKKRGKPPAKPEGLETKETALMK